MIPSSASSPDAIIYGPIVHGKRKSVTINPMINAPVGEVILLIQSLTLGLRNKGISVVSPPGLYMK